MTVTDSGDNCPTCFYSLAPVYWQKGTERVGGRDYCPFHAAEMGAFLDEVREQETGN